ncbi:unnamed protein product [Urochloa humidicola]
MLDETVWTAAREFRPERFLDGGEGCGVDITGSREIKMMPFGAGPRICPGYAIGIHHAEYFVARMATLLQPWLPGVGDGERAQIRRWGGSIPCPGARIRLPLAVATTTRSAGRPSIHTLELCLPRIKSGVGRQ